MFREEIKNNRDLLPCYTLPLPGLLVCPGLMGLKICIIAFNGTEQPFVLSNLAPVARDLFIAGGAANIDLGRSASSLAGVDPGFSQDLPDSLPCYVIPGGYTDDWFKLLSVCVDCVNSLFGSYFHDVSLLVRRLKYTISLHNIIEVVKTISEHKIYYATQ